MNGESSQLVAGDRFLEPQAAGVLSICGTLATGTRLELLERLLLRPRSVTDLAHACGLETSLVSHHLKRLRDAGLVENEQDGHRHRYRAARHVTLEARNGRATLCVALAGGGECTFAGSLVVVDPRVEVKPVRREMTNHRPNA